jgi:glycosyltransferase involved in cell wall biosynthesis
MPTPTICLNMIIKDEAPVIRRCLESVKPFIDRWVIVDTGSTDDTREQVREIMADLPGELHERPWKNFGHNRNEALSLAASSGDYIFFIDADERLELPASYQRPPLGADGYHLNVKYAGISYARCALVASRLPWRWEGVVHEYLACGSPFKLETLEGPRVIVAHDGARSRDPETYKKDAALLEEALRQNPDNTRDTFYLAQSYRDAGELEKSRDVYRRRAGMKGWEEEGWFAQYQAVVMEERLGSPPEVVSFGYLSAYQRRPTRAEPLVRLARYHRLRSEFHLALLYARWACTLPKPPDLLFLDDATYAWSALDELAVAAYYVDAQQAKEEGRNAVRRLLAENRFPESERARMLKNAEFYGVAREVAARS